MTSQRGKYSHGVISFGRSSTRTSVGDLVASEFVTVRREDGGNIAYPLLFIAPSECGICNKAWHWPDTYPGYGPGPAN